MDGKRIRMRFSIFIFFIFITSLVSGELEAGNFILNAVDAGHYYNSGLHQPGVWGYVAGYHGGADPAIEWRDFFVFDLSPVTGFVIEAELRLWNPAQGYWSVDLTETFELHDVSTPISTLVTGGTGLTGIFNDLGSGQYYGSLVMSAANNNQLVSIPLTWPTCMDINSHINSEDYLFAIGGSLTTINPVYGQYQQVFSGTGDWGSETKQLVLRTNAGITVFMNSDQTKTEQVNGFFFDPGSQVTLEIDHDNDGSVDYTTTKGLDADGVVRFWSGGVLFAVQAGDHVRLFDDQDPQTNIEHVVDYLTLDNINPVADTLSGKADPGKHVFIRVWDPDLPFPQGPEIEVIAGTSGTWSANFSGVFDLLVGTWGWVQTADVDGDHTQISWQIPDTIPVVIDILPGSDRNYINLKNKKGAIAVAILGGAEFDVQNIDIATLVFEGASPAHDLSNAIVYADHLRDVNNDGYLDLVSHYWTKDTSISSSSTCGCLSGSINGGTINGCDSVEIK